ncbi:MAG: hypothetical protein HYX51_05585 [Chloroflexi bacterium]|nr:hypothetical protein [Chloroflexota bacterium]
MQEAETRQYFAEAQAKQEFPIAGTGIIDLKATHTPATASCQGTSTQTQRPVRVSGTIEGSAVKLQIFATSSVRLMETCFGVRCAAMDYGHVCPGGAQDPAQGSSEHQLPLLGTLLAGGDLSFGLNSDAKARLSHTSDEDTVTREIQIAADAEEEPQAVAVALGTTRLHGACGPRQLGVRMPVAS